MKLLEKTILIGVITFILSIFVNIYCGSLIGVVIPGGDDFINSYFFPIYGSINLLIAILISSTYLIVNKLNELLEKNNSNK